jgi:hypothetical protein
MAGFGPNIRRCPGSHWRRPTEPCRMTSLAVICSSTAKGKLSPLHRAVTRRVETFVLVRLRAGRDLEMEPRARRRRVWMRELLSRRRPPRRCRGRPGRQCRLKTQVDSVNAVPGRREPARISGAARPPAPACPVLPNVGLCPAASMGRVDPSRMCACYWPPSAQEDVWGHVRSLCQ